MNLKKKLAISARLVDQLNLALQTRIAGKSYINFGRAQTDRERGRGVSSCGVREVKGPKRLPQDRSPYLSVKNVVRPVESVPIPLGRDYRTKRGGM